MNLGYLIPKGSNLFPFGARHQVSLPSGVKYASAWMYSITPSLICVVVGFVFEDDLSEEFDMALRTDRHTYTTHDADGSESIHLPEFQKTHHICNIRKRLKGSAATWFKDNIPGLFSDGLPESDMPTCEFVTLRGTEPFPSRTDSEHNVPEYLNLLDMGHNYNVWQSKRIPALKFRPQSAMRGMPPNHSVVAIREKASIDRSNSDYGGQEMQDILAYVDTTFPSLLSVWGILPLLERYTQHVREVRDSAMLRPTARRNTIDVLETLQCHISNGVDIAAVASELVVGSESRIPFPHFDESFVYWNNRQGEEQILRKELNDAIGMRSNWLQQTERSIRDHLTQFGTVLGAAENVRVQSRIKYLTWVLVILTVVILFAALVPEDLKQEILSFVKRFLPM